ncbi:MAG TPA: hypothetical protein VFH70_06830 [Acidimicrobiales bacterium]|nr:hypothetical protein [Acidimicrobiales bacterium]
MQPQPAVPDDHAGFAPVADPTTSLPLPDRTSVLATPDESQGGPVYPGLGRPLGWIGGAPPPQPPPYAAPSYPGPPPGYAPTGPPSAPPFYGAPPIYGAPPPTAPPSAPRRSNRVLWIVLAAVVVVIAGGVGIGLSLGHGGHSGANVQLTYTILDYSGDCAAVEANDNLRQGSTLTVTGGGGRSLGTVALGSPVNGTADLTNGSETYSCELAATLSVPDNESSYKFEVGSLPPKVLSNDELTQDAWSPLIRYNCPSDLQGGC